MSLDHLRRLACASSSSTARATFSSDLRYTAIGVRWRPGEPITWSSRSRDISRGGCSSTTRTSVGMRRRPRLIGWTRLRSLPQDEDATGGNRKPEKPWHSWPEQVRSWCKSLDSDFFGRKRATEAFRTDMGLDGILPPVKLAACGCPGLTLCKGLDIRPGPLICITGIVDMTTRTRAPANVTFSTADLADAHDPPPRRRGRDLGNARGQLRPDVPGDVRDAKGAINQISTGRGCRLEEPDAHAESRRDLPDAVLQHRRTRADGARDPAGRRRRRSTARSWTAWQGRSRMSGPAGVDKGKGGKYLIMPPEYTGEVPRRLHRLAVAHLSGLSRCCARS